MTKLEKAIKVLSIISIVFVSMSVVMSLVFALLFSAGVNNGACEEVWKQMNPAEQKFWGSVDAIKTLVRWLSIGCFVVFVFTLAVLITSALICRNVTNQSKSIFGLSIVSIILGLFAGSLITMAMGICGCCLNRKPIEVVKE